MERYGNLSGNAGVTEYEIGPDHIRIRFRSGDTYLYDYTQPGQTHVERMKVLALSGKGLSTYISQHVKRAYASKEP